MGFAVDPSPRFGSLRSKHSATGGVLAAGFGVLVALVAMLGSLMLPAPAAAESPVALAEELAVDGVYVSRVRTDIDEAALVEAVKQVQFDGLRLVAVAPIDPQPDGAAFARRIQEAVDADAAMIFLADGTLETYVIDELNAARIRATDKARAINDPARAVLVFADELATERTRGRPQLVGQLIMAVVVLSLIIGLAVAVEQSLRATRNRHTTGNVTR